MQYVLSAVNEISSRIRSQIEKNVSVVSAMKQPPGGKKTFAEDELLPALPLPELSHTLERYLDSVQPHVTPEMLLRTEAIVKEFEEGVGKELQENLRQRAASNKNWLEKWWEEKAYLENRAPLLPFCCMIGHMNAEDIYPNFESGSMIERASLMTYYLNELWQLLRSERLTTFGERQNVFSMHQFRRLFNCTRAPLPHRDQLETYFKTESEGDCPSHVIVCCNGRVYCVDATFEGSVLTAPEWRRQLQYVVDNATSEGPGLGVACLSCDQRDKWAANKKRLEELSEENKRVLRLIDTAVHTLILAPDAEAKTPTQVLNIPASLYRDIWVDKSCNLLVWNNGQASPFGDHSAYDGTTSVTCTFYIYQNLLENGTQWMGSSAVRDIPTPKQLHFTIDEILTKEMTRAKEEQIKNQENVRILPIRFPDFGKNFLKKSRIHPDMFVQLAIHLSYVRLHGKPAPCYETATTRGYYHGRTETVRTCTKEVMDWVHSMQSESTQETEKLQLMREAADRLVILMKEAKENAGCDRHLFGLMCSALENDIPMPAIFTDPSFFLSGGTGNFLLSTSLVGYTPIGGVVAPMCDDGYGCFYNILPDHIRFVLSELRSSSVTDVDRFIQEIFSSMREMHDLLETAAA